MSNKILRSVISGKSVVRFSGNRQINVPCYSGLKVKYVTAQDSNGRVLLNNKGKPIIIPTIDHFPTKNDDVAIKEHNILFDTIVSVFKTKFGLENISIVDIFRRYGRCLQMLDVSELLAFDAKESKRRKEGESNYRYTRQLFKGLYEKGFVILGYGSSAKTGTLYLLRKEYKGVNILEELISQLGINDTMEGEKKFNPSRWEILYQPAVKYTLSKAYDLQVVELKDKSGQALPSWTLDGVSVVPDSIINEIVSNPDFGEEYGNGFKGMVYSPKPSFGAKGIFISHSFYEDIRTRAPRLPELDANSINILSGAYKWGKRGGFKIDHVWIHSNLLGKDEDCQFTFQLYRFFELTSRADKFIDILPKNVDEGLNDLVHTNRYDYDQIIKEYDMDESALEDIPYNDFIDKFVIF